MRSQVVGIAWIIAVLVTAVGWYFFSSQRAGKPAEAPPDSLPPAEKLTQKEDSVYRARRKTNLSSRNTERYHRAEEAESTLYTREAPPRRKQALRVELNSADTTTLQLMHGIGPAFANRIVKYRERLGGFVADSQLLEVYGFTPSLLEHIRPHLTLDTSHRRRLRINSVSLKELARHPYIEYYQARDLVNLRAKGVIFSTEEDLRAVPSMADSTLRRMKPYLDFGIDTAE